MKLRRTLLTAGVFALLAMIYVPTPHQGYRAIFSQRDTSIAFFQLLANVVFAALLGGILATTMPKITAGVRRLPTWVWRGIGGIVSIALLSTGAPIGILPKLPRGMKDMLTSCFEADTTFLTKP